jgi:quercetin dioxygenase-like cupin family protein
MKSSTALLTAFIKLVANAKAQGEWLMLERILLLTTVIMSLLISTAFAQQSGPKRTILRTIEYPPGYSTVTVAVELAPGSCTGHHTHPGVDSGYVLEGDLLLKIDGKPDQSLKAGGSYEVSPHAPHDACTVAGLKVLDTFVIEKGKPLASPAP